MRRFLILWLLLLTIPSTLAMPASDPGAPKEIRILVMLRLPPAHFHSDGLYGAGWDVQSGKRARWRIAEKLAAQFKLSVEDTWGMPALGVECFVMKLPASASADSVLKALTAVPEVESAQAVHAFHTLHAAPDPSGPLAPHNDPLFDEQPVAKPWHLAELHRAATGRGIAIAVIDSGIDLQHTDLLGQIRLARDFVAPASTVPESHGTAVAGVIAASADDANGIAGVAPGARLLALRACSQLKQNQQTATCDTFALAKALHFAIDEEVDIINLSLSGPTDPLLGRLLDVATARGIAVVAASPGGDDEDFPASHAGVLSVAMVGQHSRTRSVRAPGRDVPATLPGGRWGLVSGSSFSAAEVSGLVAVLRELATPSRRAQVLSTKDATLQASGEQDIGRDLDSCALAWRAARRCVCQCGKDVEIIHTARPRTFW